LTIFLIDIRSSDKSLIVADVTLSVQIVGIATNPLSKAQTIFFREKN